MSSGDSVTQWIAQLRAGDPAAAQKLWERYFRRLVGLASKKLQGMPRRAADEEDVALSAFHSFCRGATQGRFPQLDDRDNLWALLVTLTERKAFQQTLRENRRKRGGKAVLDEAALAGAADSSPGGLAELLDREPTPEFAAQVAEECRRLLGLLDPELQAVAQAKMEGHTNKEIADQLGCVVRSVERRLRVIRTLWSKEGKP
jgi:DNA-directed RNA polymerase specialized sigma24 family protein